MNVGQLFVAAALDDRKYKRDLVTLENYTHTAGVGIGNALKLAIGVPAITIGALLVAVGAAAFKSGKQAEEAFKRIRVGTGAAGDELDAYMDDWRAVNRLVPQAGEEVADVLVEVRKRMGAQGAALRYLTKSTLDYARVNREDAADSARTLGRLMKALDVDINAMPGVMDKMTLAAQKTGIGVNELSNLIIEAGPAFGEMGYGLDKSIALFAQFEAAGANPREVLSSLDVVMTRMAKQGITDIREGFADLLQSIKDAPTLLEGVQIAVEGFGARAGAKIADDIRAGRFEVDKFADSLADATGTLEELAKDTMGFTERLALLWKDVQGKLEPLGAMILSLAERAFPILSQGISIAGVLLTGLLRVFTVAEGIFTRNWGLIRFLGASLLGYVVITKAAAFATTAFNIVSLTLKGQLATNIPLFSALSAAIGTYRLQMALAPVATNIFTGALYRLQAAIYAVWGALGPIGWIVIGLAAAVGIGTHLWSKYAASVRKASEAAMGVKMNQQQEDLAKSLGKTTDGIEDQEDALEGAGKAAGKNVQSFDEVHQLQEDMADSGADMLDGLDIEGLLDDMGGAGGPAFDFEGMMAGLEELKPTWRGFWEWIKEQAGNLWERVKEKWNGFWNWVKSWGLWQWLADRWDGLKEWAGNVWEGVKERWEGFKSWVASWAGPLWDGIKEKWAGFKEWAATMWDGAKEKWGHFTDWVAEKWSNFRTKAGEIWDGIKTTVQSKWEALKTNAPIIWENIKTSIQTRWENLKTSAGETWNNITTGIKETWNNLKTNAPIVWENIKTSIQDRWNSLVSGASEKWGNIKSTISEKWEELKTNAPITWENIKKEISDRWEALKTNAPIAWENIKTSIQDRWNNLKTNAPTVWENIKTSIQDRWEALKTNAPTAWNNISKTIKDSWKNLKTSVPATWNDIKKAIADKWREIKEDALSWGKNLIGGFVQGVKDKIPSIKGTLKNVGNTIKDFLGFSSPTKEGPGRDADNWAPNLMQMYAGGITAGIPKVRSAVNAAASELTGLTAMPSVPSIPTATAGIAGSADAIAQAVYRAMMDAARITSASTDNQPQGTQEIVLRIDSATFARLMLPSIIKEGQRQGLNLVVQPQGV